MSSLTIGALARRARVGVETVRFYERRGLVRRPARPRAGYRAYPQEAVGRIRFIRNAQALGFTLQEVKELLALRPSAGTSCAAVRSRASAKVADGKRRLADLERIRKALEALIAVCPGRGALAYCSILEVLDSAELEIPDIRPPARRRRDKGVEAMKSLEMKIDGMQCEGCASTIQSILSREPGVKSSSVSFEKRGASVFYDPQETDPARLAAAVAKAGFTVENPQ
jgi:MerR family mercuric resistance operon transcriptional regulator